MAGITACALTTGLIVTCRPTLVNRPFAWAMYRPRVGLGGHHRHHQVPLFGALRTSRASRAAVAGASRGGHRDTGHRDGGQAAVPQPAAMAGWHGGAGPGAPRPARQDSSDPAAAWRSAAGPQGRLGGTERPMRHAGIIG